MAIGQHYLALVLHGTVSQEDLLFNQLKNFFGSERFLIGVLSSWENFQHFWKLTFHRNGQKIFPDGLLS